MNVYLLLIDEARYFFYSAEDGGEDADKDADVDAVVQAKTGSDRSWTSRMATRLVERLERVKNSWQNAEGGVLGKAHRWWDWLHTFIHPQESMLVRFYWARRINLHYPTSRSEEIREIWRAYLRGRFWHHLLWLGINAIIVPFVAILAILPGPNIIGFWFTYRAIRHGLIMMGIRRALRDKIPIELTPSDALDHPVHRDEKGMATHRIFRWARNHHRLHVYYEWAGGKHPPIPSQTAPPIQPSDSNPVSTGQGDRRTAHENPELQHP